MTGGNMQVSVSIQQAQGQVQTQQAKAWGTQAQQSFSRALEKASGNDYSASRQNTYKGRDGGETTRKAQDTRKSGAATTGSAAYEEDASVTYVRTVVERVEAYVQTTTVNGGADDGEPTLGDALRMLLASLQRQTEQGSQNEAAEMAAALMIALLAPNQDMVQEQLAQLLSGDVSILGQTGMLSTLRSFFGDANMAKTFSGAIGDMASVLQGEMGLMEKAEGVSSIITSLRYTMVEVTTIQKSDLALTSGFQQSMQQLAKDLQSALEDMDDGVLDIDALQSQVDSGAFLRSLNAFAVDTPGAANLMGQFDIQDIANQMLQQVQEEIGGQRSEFEMTLSPESLGKITVKLVEEAGRMSLTITAANAQTQRLLTGSLAELRTAMAPYEVEIAQTEVTASEPAQQEQDIPWDQQGGGQQSQQQQSRQEEEEFTDEDFRRILAGTIGFGGGMQFTVL